MRSNKSAATKAQREERSDKNAATRAYRQQRSDKSAATRAQQQSTSAEVNFWSKTLKMRYSGSKILAKKRRIRLLQRKRSFGYALLESSTAEKIFCPEILEFAAADVKFRS